MYAFLLAPPVYIRLKMVKLVRLKKEFFTMKEKIMSEAQEIHKGWNWGKMLLFTFCSLHKIQLGLSMISFRPSLVYFRILYIVRCLLTWWIKKSLARGRMSHSDTSLWERMKENPQISLSIIYLECIQHCNWWLSTDKLSLQATSYHIWFCPHHDW